MKCADTESQTQSKELLKHTDVMFRDTTRSAIETNKRNVQALSQRHSQKCYCDKQMKCSGAKPETQSEELLRQTNEIFRH